MLFCGINFSEQEQEPLVSMAACRKSISGVHANSICDKRMKDDSAKCRSVILVADDVVNMNHVM